MIPDSLCANGAEVAVDMHVECSCCMKNITVDDCNDCDVECADVELILITDQYSKEDNSFILTNTLTDSDVWNVGKLFLLPSTTTNYTANVCPRDCYHFELLDSYGDGICCEEGDGDYSLSYQGQIVSSGGSFGSSIKVSIGDGC